MKISYNWLKEYVYFYATPQELADNLTSAGLVVADIKSVDDDFCIEVEVTSNRPDCLGIIGIAREVGAVGGWSLHVPETNIVGTEAEGGELVLVVVEEPELCPHYTARIIKNLTVEPSPEWMQNRLKCIGLRPVNNVVDITNYVMMETGQPLHAFDLDTLSERKIIIRRASGGEEIVTINGARRALFHDMLVIADGRRPVAIAGIMGGRETEVSASTRNILLECAQFDPRQVRRTSKELGITSDSSYRFERGIDPEGVNSTSQRAVNLIEKFAGGKRAGRIIDIRTGRREEKKITLRTERLHKILGVEIKRDVAVDILKRLHFKIINDVDGFIDVEVPTFRGDIYREIDLIEEVARIYGYNNLPTRTSIHVRSSLKNRYEIVEDCIRQSLIGLGFYEAKTFGIVGISPLQSVNLWADKDGIDIANPLRQEESRLRTCLLPSLLHVKKYNMNHFIDQVRIFEVAKVYLAGDKKLPLEKTCLSAVADLDFYSLKGVVEVLLSNLGIAAECEWISYETSRSILLFQTGKVAQIKLDGNILGYLGESRESEFKTSPCMMELDMDLLVEKSNFTKKYQNLLPYPPVFRDLAIIVHDAHTWSDIRRCIKDVNVNYLRDINFFDVYRGKQIPDGSKSIAFNLRFQSPDRTLSSEEVDVELQTIVDSLQRTLGAELRKI